MPPDGVWKTYIPARGSTRCCCSLLWPSRQSTPCIMPPYGSTTGKCQSQGFGICNLREAKHFASVSLLFLTQHIAKGLHPTVQDLQWSVTRNRKWWWWMLDTQISLRLASSEKLLCVMSYSKSHLSEASAGLCHVSFQQMTKYSHRANTHRLCCL